MWFFIYCLAFETSNERWRVPKSPIQPHDSSARSSTSAGGEMEYIRVPKRYMRPTDGVRLIVEFGQTRSTFPTQRGGDQDHNLRPNWFSLVSA